MRRKSGDSSNADDIGEHYGKIEYRGGDVLQRCRNVRLARSVDEFLVLLYDLSLIWTLYRHPVTDIHHPSRQQKVCHPTRMPPPSLICISLGQRQRSKTSVPVSHSLMYL